MLEFHPYSILTGKTMVCIEIYINFSTFMFSDMKLCNILGEGLNVMYVINWFGTKVFTTVERASSFNRDLRVNEI